MRNFLLKIMMLMYLLPVFANNNECTSKIIGFKIVKNSVYPFTVDNEKACFFAFYTVNPEPMVGTRGNGNLGDSLWYGYFIMDNPRQIYQFPKPSDTDWGMVCSIEAISFYPMHGGKKRDVTIIGSCDKQNAVNYTVPFVFTWTGNKYVLDEDVYSSLFGFVSLTVTDVRQYIKSSDSYYKVLKERNNLN